MKISSVIHKFRLKVKSKSLFRDSITTTIWSTIGKAIGFLVPFFLARWFGVSSETDAFYFAYGLVLFLSQISGSVMESIIVPHIAEFGEKNKDVGSFVGKILSISTAGLAIVIILLIPAIKPFISLVTDFNSVTLDLIYILFLETIVIVIIVTWNSILVGSINTYKKFMIPALSPGFRAIVNLIIIFSFKDILGVHAIVLGYVLGELFRTIVLVISIYKMKLFSFKFSFSLDSDIKNFFRVSLYQMLGMIAIGLNLPVDKIMASWLKEGSVSILYYAQQLYLIPATFIVSGLIVTLLSYWSWKFFRKDYKDKILKDVNKAIKAVVFVSLPLMIILIILSKPIVSILFGRGTTVDVGSLYEVRKTWLFYLVGFMPSMVERVFSRAHLALKNTGVLMKCGSYSFILNILLNYILMKYMGVAGIALATSLVSIFSLFYYRWAFYRKLKEFEV